MGVNNMSFETKTFTLCLYYCLQLRTVFLNEFALCDIVLLRRVRRSALFQNDAAVSYLIINSFIP